MKYTEAILPNSTWNLLWFEIINILTAHTHPFNGPIVRDYPGEPVPER